MSGFEIAGLVLGALPIVYSTSKKFISRFQKARSWWLFEAEFEDFVASLARQEIAYTQVLKRLLDPLDITDGDFDDLLRHPALWGRVHIQEELHKWFSPRELQWVAERLGELHQAITSIQALLLPEQASTGPMDPARLESEFQRLYVSFSSEKDRLLGKICAINDELHQFLDRASTMTRKSVPKPKVPFRDLQRQAIGLYDCLSKRWRCCCPVDHTLGISAQVASQISSRGPHLTVLFNHKAGRKRVRVEVEAIEEVYSQPPCGAESPSLAVDFAAASKMSHHVTLKKEQKAAKSAMKGKGVASLSISSLTLTGADEGSSAGANPTTPRSILRRAGQKIQKWKAWNAPSHGPPQPDGLFMDSFHTSSSFQATASSSSTLVVTGSSHDQIKSQPFPAPRVRFASASSNVSANSGAGSKAAASIADMCDFVKREIPPEAEKDGSMLAGDGMNVVFYSDAYDQSTLDDSEMNEMDSFLSHMPMRFDRLAVGLHLAITLLSLATSHWIPASLDQTRIFLLCGSSPMTKPLGPFVSRTSREICSPAAEVCHARSSLLFLGVALLELFFGEKLEKQPSWTESLVNGRPSGSTRFTSAFLWVCRADDSFKEYFGNDLGGALSAAIRKCICFDFRRESDLGDAQFVELVYKEVVVPLERCCPS